MIFNFVRTSCLAAVVLLAAWFAGHGINLDPAVTNALGVVVVGVALGAASAAVHWLETRTGEGLFAKLSRGLALLLTLGGASRPPVYAPRDKSVRTGDGEVLRAPITKG